jgi:uncharacterized protein YegJ (DUF2314 family)
MLSLAIENKMFCLKKSDISHWMGIFYQEKSYDGESITAVMGSTSKKSTSTRYQTLGFK